MENYQSVLPEHEPLVPRLLQRPEEPEHPYGRAYKWAAGLGLLLALIIVSMSVVASDSSDHTVGVAVEHAAAPIVGLTPYAVPREMTLESHFERLEGWKSQIQQVWGPFMKEAKTHWSDVQAQAGEDGQMTEEEMEDWRSRFSQAAVLWWNATAYASSEWWEDAERKGDHTGEWINDERVKSGEWIHNEGAETSEWFNESGQKSAAWLKDQEHKPAEWFRDEGEKTSEWVKDTENKSATWLQDEEHKTAAWFNKTGHKSGDWLQDEEHKTGEWFNGTEHKVGGFFSEEGHKTASWFNATEHKSGDWIKTEADKISEWFNKSEHHTADWFHHAGGWVKDEVKHEINETEDWWNETRHEEKDWWYNITHKALPEFVIYLNQTSAYRMLTNGIGFVDYAQDYFAIQQGLDAQINQAYCGVATTVAILNSLRGHIELPIDPIYDPYSYATQHGVFNECTDQSVIVVNETFDGILTTPYGVGMAQVAALLACHLDTSEWNITANHLDPILTTVDEFRQDMQETLVNPLGRVMINYDRKSAGQIGGGHWSPIGAYSPHMDAFLVMDVAKYKYPNAWISTSLLYKSLQTYDTCGLWDFPMAQSKIFKTKHKMTPIDVMNAMVMLGCEPTRRGYITIKKNV